MASMASLDNNTAAVAAPVLLPLPDIKLGKHKRGGAVCARQRRPVLYAVAAACPEGEHGRLDPILGGVVVNTHSRAMSRAGGGGGKALVDFHDDLRSGQYNVDQARIVTDPVTIARGLAQQSSLLQHVVT